MSKIEDIASKHLGKAGDGTVVKPYVTPDDVDASLLVAIPRYLNREQYQIRDDHLPFIGYDVWHAYEISFMKSNGIPVSAVAKIVYPCESRYIVESKSIKLYLNSYNMTVWNTVEEVTDQIQKHLSKCLQTVVQVTLFTQDQKLKNPITIVGATIEDYVQKISVTSYNETPDLLKGDERQKLTRYHSRVLRSNCRVTNQPDWGDVYIDIEANSTPTKKSMLEYLVSFRNENHFHEEVCECIYKRLYDMFQPKLLMVACLYTRRGGIDINPVRCNNDVALKNAQNLIDQTLLTHKTMRQ